MKKALVVNIARMGDLIQSVRLCAGLQSEGYELSLLYSDSFASIAQMLPGIDRRIPFPLSSVVGPLIMPGGRLLDSYSAIARIIDELHAEDFDLVVNITHTHFSAVLCALIGGKQTVGMTLDSSGQRLVNGRWVNYYLNACLNRGFNRFNLVDLHRKSVGVGQVNVAGLTIDAEARNSAEKIVTSAMNDRSSRLVGVVPGASTPEKRWPVEYFASSINALRSRYNVTPLILGSPAESDLTKSLAALIPGSVNLGGKTGLPVLAAVIEKCELLITNDTGPMHIAATVGTTVLCIATGSAIPSETAPYGEGHITVEPRIGCYPCLPKLRCGHATCHSMISPGCISSLAGAMLDGQDLNDLHKQIPELGKSVNINRTFIDSDGYLDLQPLGNLLLDRRTFISLALREVWKKSLDGLPGCGSDFEDKVKLLSVWMNQNYLRESLIELTEPAVFKGFFDSLDRLGGLALKGKKYATELISISTKPNTAIIKELGSKLKSVDDAIIQLAHSAVELLPLATQFTYSKDGLNGCDIASLARQTEGLYNELLDWCSSLDKWIRALLGVLKDNYNAQDKI